MKKKIGYDGLKNENSGIRVVAHIVMTVASILALFPFMMLISSSLTSVEAIAVYGYSFFPKEISFSAYEYLFTAWSVIGKAYFVSLLVTVIGTLLSLLVTTMLAFGLAWNRTPGRKIIMVLLIITLLFNGGVVSTYVIYTNVLKVHNTIWGLILPGLLMNAFSVLLFMNYFRNTVSLDLMDAAQIDGANIFDIYWRIFIPLSLPIIGTLGLLSAIAYWNDWTNSLFYISASADHLHTIPRLLREMQESVRFIAQNPDSGLSGIEIPSASVQMAIAVLGILPIMIAYPFFQKLFVAGIAIGGVKE